MSLPSLISLLESSILLHTDKPVQFEISLGNAGNTLDGQILSVAGPASESRRGSTTAVTLVPPKPDELDAGSAAAGFDDGK